MDPGGRESDRGSGGFSLIELMLCIALIGVLASIALPYMGKAMIRARRTEAYAGLKGIYAAQVSYKGEVGRYAGSFDELGFSLDGGKVVDENTIDGLSYRFQIGAYEYQGQPNGNFWATATADLFGNSAFLDVLLVEDHVVVKE